MIQARDNLYKKYGVYVHTQQSLLEGKTGMEKMKEIMTGLRENPPAEIGGLKVTKISDYIKSVSVDTQTGEQTQITLQSQMFWCSN